MQSRAATVDAYLAELPDDRREALQAVRKVILANLDRKFQEGMSYGMIGYYVPHSVFPPGYHCDPRQPLPFAGLASQKGHMSLYLMCIYGDDPTAQWFDSAWKKTGKKLNRGKSCIRFKKVDELALDVIAALLKRIPAAAYIRHYQASLGAKAAAPTPKPRIAAGKPKTIGKSKPARKKSIRK